MTKTSYPSFSSVLSNYHGHNRITSRESDSNAPSQPFVITSQFELPIATRFSSSIFGASSTYEDYRIEHLDIDANWYRKYFIGKEHLTLVGYVEPYEPVVISMVLDDRTTADANCEGVYWYRYIMRKKELPDNRGLIIGPPMSPGGEMPSEGLLKMISRGLNRQKLNKFVLTPDLTNQLLSLDETRLQKCYKIGVLYCAPWQQTEEEWFSNTTTSTSFDKFLTILGTKVRLLGFKGFAGGLDTRNGGSGDYSIYDRGTWKDFEIMYHVCTLLPYERFDKHQITRKRHIGNDVTCIVFQDVRRPFDPCTIRSQFLHVYVVVSPVRKDAYHVDIVCKEGVPYFGPALPEPPIFDDPLKLKRFLVATVINGRNAAWKAPKLSEPFLRARGAIIQDIVDKLVPPQLASATSLSSKKTSQDFILKRLLKEHLKVGVPPPLEQLKTLLERGANPNIRISQPKQPSSPVTPTYIISRHSSLDDSRPSQHPIHKFPNVLFAVITLCDDPLYCKLLINYGVDVAPKDPHFPNAFTFAARHKRVEIMKCLLESVPGLGNAESVGLTTVDSIDSSGGGTRTREIKKMW
ncbi:2542_t:CDS:2, partial [Acaulospora colombiana]